MPQMIWRGDRVRSFRGGEGEEIKINREEQKKNRADNKRRSRRRSAVLQEL